LRLGPPFSLNALLAEGDSGLEIRMNVERSVLSAAAFMWLMAGPTGAAEGILLEVTAGRAEATDWIAQADLDLATAQQLLQVGGRPDQVTVYELEGSGEPGKPVPSQVDPTDRLGIYTLTWRVPGTLAAGPSRKFLVRFGGGEAPVRLDVAEDTLPAVSVRPEGDIATVANGDILLEHHRGHGGMIRRVTVGGAVADLTWNDKIYDGTVYYLANHPANRMDVTARGPLRATLEVAGEYLDAGQSAPSKPRALYRFTTCAGLPFTLVEADVEQDFAHPWISLHFIEMQIGEAGFTHLATEGLGGALKQEGQFYGGARWAAAYNERVLIATCASRSPGVWDGGGRHYGAYVRGGVAPLNTLRYPWKGAILWGAGAKALEEKAVQRWSEILADPPAVQVHFEPLAKRLASVEERRKEKERMLAGLSGEAWAVEHVALTLAGLQVARAEEALATGRFGEALQAMESGEQALQSQAGEVKLRSAGTVQVGLVRGYPFLGNEQCAYLWSKPEEGAGLISLYDRRAGREFLKGDPGGATFWEIAVKQARGGTTYQSAGRPGHVHFDVKDGEGRLEFRWEQGVTVAVEARLAAEDPLLRARIQARTKTAAEGLVTVTFPLIQGIRPLTPEARQDIVLDTWQVGWARPSPLVSGEVLSINYPAGMNFTALTGDGLGLYLAEEDGEANQKQLTWSPDQDAGTLDFSISHPVLNWGAEEPVREYEPSGDLVGGPFHGDWYDAARLYRKWALTAPWCAKGPIHQRPDYPQWLAEAPYWSIGQLGDEAGLQWEMEKHDFFGLPTMVCHAYGYWFALHQDDRYPEHWPPKLGSAGFKRAVAQLQAKGIRIVPYINGWLWDMDTESWRTKDARKGAIQTASGDIINHTSYGGGQSLVGMCPASELWRQEMLDLSTELVGRYGVDGLYFDFLTIHTSDCYHRDHGHPICGGNYWTKAVHGLYEEVREECRKLNPEVLLTGEDIAEFCVDVQDTFFCSGQAGTQAPLFFAVYHGYANVYGGADINRATELKVGRWWLMGGQNGWNNMEGALIGQPPYEPYAPLGRYYRKLLRCRWEFGTPYLGYGEMLRPPQIEGDLPTITQDSSYGPFTAAVVEGSAWKAPDGSIGVFFLNYDEQRAHSFTWTMNLEETGIDASKKVSLSAWTEEAGLTKLKEIHGGLVRETLEIPPLGIGALKLEAGRGTEVRRYRSGRPAGSNRLAVSVGERSSDRSRFVDRQVSKQGSARRWEASRSVAAAGSGDLRRTRATGRADLKVPPGCVPAQDAQAGANGYADRVIHERTGIELILIPPGSFTMGSTEVGSHASPPHEVTFTQPFYLGRTEVTNAQYRRFVAATGYDGKPDTDPAYDLYLRHWRGYSPMSSDDDYPVVWVSWRNARAFCDWAGLALPTEAQWEYACRAGTTTEYYHGDDQSGFDECGWGLTNSEGQTHPVARKKPNAWGLYDLLGNVWEWVEDDYVYRYDGAPTDGSARLEGKMTKVLRGGSWSNSTRPVTNGGAARFNSAPGNASNDVGFRVALGVE